MKTLRKSLLLFAAGAGSLLAALPSHAQTACVAGNWVSPPNTYWDSLNGSYPVRYESAHFQLRPSTATLLTAAEAQAALNAMEQVYTWFMGPQVNWPEPFCDSATKYKVQIFTADGYGLAGSGAGPRAPAMWVAPGALRDVAAGLVNGMVHEFTHALQYSTQGMRNTIWGGWFWESHAEFMAHQYPGNPDKVGCSSVLAWMPHQYYGSTRNRYCNWQFWDHLKNKNGGFKIINDLWTRSANIDGQDPLGMLISNMGWSAATLGDEFGLFAMRNVNWDYIDVQNGYNRGADYRREFGGNTVLTNRFSESSQRLRLAKVEPIDLANRRFVVSKYYAPQRYGYNLVRLIPDAGATSVTVNFRGVVQNTIAPGTSFGNGNALEPGSAPDWTSATMPTNPASNWRWGIVAIDQNGNSRQSALQRGTSGNLTFAMQTGDRELYMVVVAAPDAYHRIFWDQMYYTLYRYPYKLQLSGAMPDGFQSGYQINTANGWPAGAKHANGGGWVASTARVDATAYVGPNAAVLGGQVLGNARIEDYAVVWSGTVRDTAIVGGLTQFDRNSTVAGQAQVRAVVAGGQTFSWDSTINGTTKLCGDVEAILMAGVPLSSGAYCGFITTALASTNPAYGSNRSQIPTEATAATPPGWPDVNTAPTVSLSAPAVNLSVVQGTIVNLAANAADADGSVAKVDFYDGTTLLGIDTTAPYTLAWTATTAGARGITARATDNNGAVTTSAAVTVNVTVPIANRPPTVALTAPAANASVAQGAVVTLSATAADSDGRVSKVDFYDGTTLLATVTAAPYNYSWTNAAVGAHALTARATDNAGATATTPAVTLTVTATATTNLPPTVALTAPANGTSAAVGTAVTLSANAADTDGTVSRVEFYRGSTLLGSATAAPFRLVWTPTTAGSYTLTARAYDNRGATTTSAAATLTVTTAAAGVTNLATSATLATSYVSAWESLGAVNNNIVPTSSADKNGGAYGNWSGTNGQTNWVSFTWSSPRSVSAFEVYWWSDGQGIAVPSAATVQYWNGASWVSLGSPGLALNNFNRLNFAAVTTTAVRVSMSSAVATGILEARVWGTVPPPAPVLSNLAPSATLATSFVSAWETLGAVNNNIVPAHSADKNGGAYGNWSGINGQTNWVSFTWSSPRSVSAFEVYWWNDGLGITEPTAATVQYWNGTSWVSLGSPGLILDTFNRMNFAAVTTTSVRVSMSSATATGILEARVWGF